MRKKIFSVILIAVLSLTFFLFGCRKDTVNMLIESDIKDTAKLFNTNTAQDAQNAESAQVKPTKQPVNNENVSDNREDGDLTDIGVVGKNELPIDYFN